MEKQREDQTDTNEEVMPKCVLLLVVCPPHHGVKPHAPDDGDGARNEDDLHQRVVHRHDVCEEIQVAGQEHQRVQLLRPQRDP